MIPVRLVIAGHVDHGKSTLIGRLLADTGALPQGKLEEIQAACDARGSALEYSYLLDAFQAERDQAITIDSTQVRFRSVKRAYTLIDAPGHKEFLKNMMTGATGADAAILIVDVNEGLREQSRRHIALLKILGFTTILVVLNKMDKADYSEKAFRQVAEQVSDYLAASHMTAISMIPVAAQAGDMLTARGSRMDWYKGPTFLDALDALTIAQDDQHAPLRIVIQDVYRREEKRLIAGKILSGSLTTGARLLFSPGNATARVASIEHWPAADSESAQAGDAVTFTLDDAVFIERGYVASHEQDAPMMSAQFDARLFWLSSEALTIGAMCTVRYGTTESSAQVQAIHQVTDTQDLSYDEWTQSVPKHGIASVTFTTREKLPFEPPGNASSLNRLVVYQNGDVAGCGLIDMSTYADQRQAPQTKSSHVTRVRHAVTPDMRTARNGHKGGVFWFTGLSGAGKSTVAMAAEQALFAQGLQVCVLDGDNLRHGLNGDLGFSAQDRAENSRRAGEVAALQARSGLIVMAALISPYQADRDKARAAYPQGFHEIYIRSSLDICEARDPKGLYKQARAGLIADFTGIGSPYEEPLQPNLIVDTAAQDVDSCVAQIVSYIRAHCCLSAHQKEIDRVPAL